MPLPCCAVNVKLLWVTPNVGGGVIVKVTGIVTDVAFGALRVMVVVRVDAVRAPVRAVSMMEPALVPVLGATVSQGAPEVAAQLSVPPPILLIVRV